MPTREQRIAIIGAGVAGLSAAYFLHNRMSKNKQIIFRCSILDVSARLGGNCYSAYLDGPYQSPFADLGVNDFNTQRYKTFMEVLGRLEAEGLPVPHQPLIDTTSWSTPNGLSPDQCLTYTDLELTNWEQHSDCLKKDILMHIACDWDRFQHLAFSVLHDPIYQNMSVAEFIQYQNFHPDFAEYNLLPSINGMYYVNDCSPESMPIRAVMSHYHLQGGVGAVNTCSQRKQARFINEPSPRHYFVNGASHWIRQLARSLQRRGVDFILGAPVTAHPTPDGSWVVKLSPNVVTPIQEPIPFDVLVSAVHADQVSSVIPHDLSGELAGLLARFDYMNSISIVHDDPSVLPANETAWCTYNILIYPRETTSLRPYTMTYIEPKHQGLDVNSPPFVTVTPYSPLRNSSIYTMRALPGDERIKAVQYFRHNTLTASALQAQQEIKKHHQGNKNLYFTGGWTTGAGLHEEILVNSKMIASMLRGFHDPETDSEYYSDDGCTVPRYISNSFVEDAQVFPAGFWD